jgi:hypothetical protein
MEATVVIREQTLTVNSVASAKVMLKVLDAFGIKAGLKYNIKKSKRTVKVEDLMLSTRAAFAIRRYCEDKHLDYFNITVQSFVNKSSKDEFYKLRNVGKKAISEIETALAGAGFEWE